MKSRIKAVSFSVLALVLFGSVFFDVYGRTDVRITNEFGERNTEQFNFREHRQRGRNVAKSTPRHGYLIFREVPNKALLSQIEQTGNLKVHSLMQVYRGEDGKRYPVYMVRCHAGIEYSLDMLSNGDFGGQVHGIFPVKDKDKVSKKIFENRGFNEKEKAGGNKIYASVRFFPDINRQVADSLVKVFCDTIVEVAKDGLNFTVVGTPSKLLKLSRLAETMLVKEKIMFEEPTNYDGRAILKVDEVQQFDMHTTSFPPSDVQYWSPNFALTGEGITVDVYDTGIDTMHLDFREWNSQSGVSYSPGMSYLDIINNTVFRKRPGGGSFLLGYNSHGTHVASTIGGSGWETPGTADTYTYRGVAPRVKFGAFYTEHPLIRYGNISNHSHIETPLDWYENNHAKTDIEIFENRKIVVTTSGNNGINSQYGIQRGYYSITANGKNYITVGASYSSMNLGGYPLRAEFSGMGPTRDGRIKPDIMGPGDSHIHPLRCPNNPLIVELDSVAILGQHGNVKVAWGFQGGTMGWGEPIFNHWEDAKHKIGDVTSSNGILRYEEQEPGAYIWSGPISAAPRCELNDTLLLRYKINIPDQEYSVEELDITFIWRVDGGGYHKGGSRFQIPVGDSGFNTVKVCLGSIAGDWKKYYSNPGNHENLVTIRLDISPGGILAALYNSSNTDGAKYIRMAGTSMASPHIAGVVALMLEKYKRNYLDPVGLSVDNHAFWNSTAKALLIHTATDMVKTTSYHCESPNPDTNEPVIYPQGPDYATGWGMVNAQKAIAHIDTNLFKQSEIDHGQVITYKLNKTNQGNLRVSLAWDDYAAITGNNFNNATHSKLINDLDLHVIDPSGQKHLPWVLDPLPQPAEMYNTYDTEFRSLVGIDPITNADIKPARKGIDSVNNVEVVDINNASPGEYTVVITGKDVLYPTQHFSLVSDETIIRTGGSQPGSNKLYNFTGSSAFISDTVRVTPAGVTIQINNPDYQHGAMITVRNKGQNDSLTVEWFGVIDQNHNNCQNRYVVLFGNGAQINNIASPKLGNGTVTLKLRSTTNETYLVDIDIYNWANGSGCQ